MPELDFRVDISISGTPRLDVFLADRLSVLSRSQIQNLIETGQVLVNELPRKASLRLSPGDRVKIRYDVPSERVLTPENIPLDIIFQDRDIVVINKPSGMIVHPGAGSFHNTLANALIYFFPEMSSIGPENRPGIVHRLDKATSGVIVAARTVEAYINLQAQFKSRLVEKTYIALVWGCIGKDQGEIDLPIGRHVKHGERISVQTRKPRQALTRFEVSVRYRDFTLLRIHPVTGRTHQIRVHMSASGHPVAGDGQYGRKKHGSTFPRLFLHAASLKFCHPSDRSPVSFSASLPEELNKVLERLKTC